MLTFLPFSASLALIPQMPPVPPQTPCPSPLAPPTECLEDPDFSNPWLPTRPVDGLLNGKFDLISTATDLGRAHTPLQPGYPAGPADAGYWVGGEGMTVEESPGDRFLRIEPASSAPEQLQRLVYQRVGAPNEIIGSPPSCVPPQNALELMTLDVRLRLGQAGDEARVTLAECDGEHWELDWFLGNTPSPFNYAGYPESPPSTPTDSTARWHFDSIDSSGTPQPMCYASTSGSSVRFYVCSAPAYSLQATVGNYVVAQFPNTALDLAMVSRFTAPETGCIRVGTRVWMIQGTSDNQSGCLLKVFRVPEGGGATQLVRQIEVPAGDTDGAVVLDRICVREGDEIEFHVSRRNISKPASFFFNPAIVYEGRRLTYRFSDAAPPLLEAQCSSCSSCKCNGDEKFKPMQAPSAVAQWSSLIQLPVGNEWMIKWPGSPPRPPLEVELSAHPANVGAVDFDDVKLDVRYWDATPADLEAEIQSYIGWTRKISSLQRDRCTDGVGNANRKGLHTSPYVTWNVRADDGEHVLLTSDMGLSPQAWERLSVDFDCQDHEDQFELFEAAWSHRNSNTGLVYENYDCESDEYLEFSTQPSPCGQVTTLDSLRATVGGSYEDVAYLDIAAIHAQAVADYGLLRACAPPLPPPPPAGWDWFDGLISSGSLPVCEPFPPFTMCTHGGSELLDNLVFLGGTAEFLRVYCAVKRWDLDHPSPTPRFASYDLDSSSPDSWLSILKKSVDQAMGHIDDVGVLDVPGDLCTDGTWWTHRDWHGLSYHFNDVFGAIGGVGRLYTELDDVISYNTPAAPTETLIRDSLHCLVTEGVRNWLVPWFECNSRGDHTGGDQVKAWLNFHQHPTLAAPLDSNIKSDEQLERALRYWLKFQYPGGTWLNVGEGLIQLTNLAGGAPAGGAGLPAIPPHAYVRGLMLAIDVTPDPRKDELRDILYTVLRTTRLKFRDAYLLPPYSEPPYSVDDLDYGFARRAPGFPNYPSLLAPPLGDPSLDKLTTGGQARLVDNVLLGLQDVGVDVVTGRTEIAAPAVDIFPPSLIVETTPPVFAFQLTLPNAGSLTQAIDERTRIGWWRFVATQWEYEQLWPHPPAWLTVQQGLPMGNTITLTATLTNPTNNPFHNQTFKIEMHSWDPSGQWDRDTSYQEW